MKILEQMICNQKEKLLKLAREIIPHLTAEDILQPFDFPQLENNAFFRYEEGILEGLLSAKAAILACEKESPNHR